MSPDIEVMRSELSKMYSGARWRRRVRRMPDDQVMAIYFRETKKREEKAKAKKQQERTDDGSDQIPF